MTLDLQAWLTTPAVPGTAAGSPAGDGTLLPGVPRGDDRLRAVIALAASFPERAAASTTADGTPDGAGPPVFAAAEDEQHSRSTAVAGWLRRAAGDPASAGVLLDHLAATGRELGDGLRPVALRDPSVVPDWAHALIGFLRAQPAAPTAETVAPGAITASFRTAAGALLPYDLTGAADTASVLGVQVLDSARADLAETLVRRLTEALDLPMRYEVQSSSAHPGGGDWDAQGGPDASQEGWLARLERLPALAFLVGTACRHWQHVYTEMFARLASDRELLRTRLWDGADPGALAAVHGDAGDRHAGGRSVALLHFADGQGVVYKPKDLRHATAYMDLVRDLNAAGLSPELHVRTVLVRSDRSAPDDGAATGPAADPVTEHEPDHGDAYGWEELVPALPCTDREGFARFYRRLGMTVRLVQLLEGRDLWSDNLLASGEYPVITDLECLLYPRVQTPPALPAGQGGLLDVLESTVVRTAMAVQPWVPSKDRPVVDIGCLSRADDLEIEPGKPALPLPPYRPVHDGEKADPWEYADEVVAGYRDMHRTLAGMRDRLASPDGPLAGFKGVWVRYIWRHTWDGYKILRTSTSPLALSDGATRETVIAGALRGAVAARAGDSARGDLLEVVLSELDSYRVLDIPFFRSLTTSSSVFTAQGHEIPGHFQSTAWDRLHARITELDRFDLDLHTAVLSGCIDAARSGTQLPPATTASRGPAPLSVPTSGELLDHAVRLGDRMLADRQRTAAGGGWIGLSWYPATGLRQVEVLSGVDLVTSGVGVALFLAELWSATGSPRFRQAAHETLWAAASLIDPRHPASFGFARDTRLASGVPVPGGLAGPGSLIHALARGAETLAEPAFLDVARALVPGAAALAAAPAGRSSARDADRLPYQDSPLGAAGLLLNLLRRRRATGAGTTGVATDADAAIRDLAEAARQELAGDTPAGRFTTPATFLDLVPTGADSIAAALARTVAEAPGLLADPDAARALLRAHRFTTTARGGRLACLDTAVSLGTGAVHPGDLAGLTPPVTAAEIAALGTRELVAAAGEALTSAEAGLLHTLDDDLAGSTAETLVPGPFFDGREAAGVLVAELLRRHHATGSWFGDRAADDRVNLGALDGGAAVGLLLLRLIDPATAPLATLR
ncbi:type 2 lanthipeptide synthetase LanM [Streptomyces sp. SID13588]|uniref:type 2 lanthipeptide synthetase LanM n=1 Tax=Streptomyces sp. SID13588 TaxID=2706051 RepID=UPI0013C89E4D|nr:type 2 lanthipeptide synthetase LanM [Streptomyces sp. SID13588]NEA70802.1 DUF4135 domain-containing protein [Streptomyces sp. SID13588]